MSSYQTIRTAIINKVKTISKITSVYGYGTPPVADFPFATVEAISNDAEFADTSDNWRTYRFRVRIHYSRTRDDQTGTDRLENAELAILRVMDDLIDAFDTDDTLGGVVHKIAAVESSVGYQELTNGPARVGEIILKCSKLEQVVS